MKGSARRELLDRVCEAEQSLHLGCEAPACAAAAHIERLDPQRIPTHIQIIAILQSECVHAVELRRRLVLVTEVELENGLAVAPGAEVRSWKCRADVQVVIHFSVYGDHGSTVPLKGLVAAGRIDDRQSAMTEGRVASGIDVESIPIRPAVCDPIHHLPDQLFVGIAVKGDDSAHLSISPPANPRNDTAARSACLLVGTLNRGARIVCVERSASAHEKSIADVAMY